MGFTSITMKPQNNDKVPPAFTNVERDFFKVSIV